MNTEQYKKKKEELVANLTINPDLVFEYDNSPYADEFDDIFSFYLEDLEYNSKYGIEPSIVFFNTNLSINAWATKYNGYYVISFNMGLIVGLIQMFKEKPGLLDEKENKEFVDFEKLLDNPIYILMYQNAVHFTFYHEMAHLVQNSDLLENRILEHLDNSEGYSERRHLLELDADEFSSISIGAHVLQYAENMFGDKVTKRQFENLLIIACGSSFLYLLSFRSNQREIYYEKFSHPHPVVRVMWIIFSIAGYCSRSLEAKGINLGLDPKEIINRTFDFCGQISKHFFDYDPMSTFMDDLANDAMGIMAYLTKFQQLKENDKTLAVFKWNQIAIEIQNKIAKENGD
ncbi:MAG: hypothetical protein IPL49_05905 [Saprospirales bacterium]|nr:hypothetical protein [Saprospirales bacterium]